MEDEEQAHEEKKLTRLRVVESCRMAQDTIAIVCPKPLPGETKGQWLERCVMLHNVHAPEADTIGAD